MNTTDFYVIEITQPDGINGYYKTPPQIWVQAYREHVRYQLRANEGWTVRGNVSAAKTEVANKILEDGKYCLTVWAEDQSGTLIQESFFEREIILDSGKSKSSIHFEWNAENRKLAIMGTDDVSGVEGISYRIGNGQENFYTTSSLYVTIPAEFSGNVSVVLKDRAGNQTQALYQVQPQEFVSQQQSPRPQEQQTDLQPSAGQPPAGQATVEQATGKQSSFEQQPTVQEIPQQSEEEALPQCSEAVVEQENEIRETEMSVQPEETIYADRLWYVPIVLVLVIFSAWKMIRRELYYC